MCISLLPEAHVGLELGQSAKGTGRLISERWSGFLCIGSCGEGGGRVSRSIWKASLFQRSSTLRKRRVKADLNTAPGTQRKAALCNHSPNFDWRVQFCSGLSFSPLLIKTTGTSSVTGALATTPGQASSNSWPRPFCLPFNSTEMHLDCLSRSCPT